MIQTTWLFPKITKPQMVEIKPGHYVWANKAEETNTDKNINREIPLYFFIQKLSRK